MAHAEKLSEQVKALTLRVHQLEAALAQAKNEAISSESQITAQDGSIHEVSKAIGSLSIGSDGQARYHGESAGSEVSAIHYPTSASNG
jgi:chromosome segregation ATPase